MDGRSIRVEGEICVKNRTINQHKNNIEYSCKRLKPTQPRILAAIVFKASPTQDLGRELIGGQEESPRFGDCGVPSQGPQN